jgi:tRNA(Met) C34 N-acetyltransferase TmcA
MMVARQFIAWYPCKNGNRPVGHGMIGSTSVRSGRQSTVDKDQTVPYRTDSRLNLFQAINCLATIIWSLRDKHTCVLMLTRMRGRGKARSTGRASDPLARRDLDNSPSSPSSPGERSVSK